MFFVILMVVIGLILGLGIGALVSHSFCGEFRLGYVFPFAATLLLLITAGGAAVVSYHEEEVVVYQGKVIQKGDLFYSTIEETFTTVGETLIYTENGIVKRPSKVVTITKGTETSEYFFVCTQRDTEGLFFNMPWHDTKNPDCSGAQRVILNLP